MIKNLVIIMILFLPLSALSGDMRKTHISQILDANLFKADNGQLMRFAGIHSPSITAADSFFARKAMAFMHDLFAAHSVYYQPDSTQNGDTLAVHLFQEYPLTTINLNARYLENGYGRYAPLSERAYNKIYIEAQNEARSARAGLWVVPTLKPPKSEPGMNIFVASYSPDFNSDLYERTSSLLQMSWQRYHGGNLFNVQVISSHRVMSGEEGFDERQIISVISYGYRGKYFGGSAGFIFFSSNGGEGPDHFGWPTFSFETGLLKKIYLSATFLNPLLQSYGSFGLHYRFDYPLGDIGLERSFSTDYLVYNLWIQVPVYQDILISGRFSYNGESRKVFPLFGIGFGLAF